MASGTIDNNSSTSSKGLLIISSCVMANASPSNGSSSASGRRRRWRPALAGAGPASTRDSERGQVGDDIGQLLRGELVLVRRHRRGRQDFEFLEIRFLQRQELFR